MGWVRVKWIPQLFAAFDALWPNRNHAQDGTIGDSAHQSSPSGHNPDDTAGSKPEREDADNIPEVRAADVDSRGVNMQAVVDAIVSNPNERKRFIYIIFNGNIWSASNGWRKAKYNGSDQHTTHAHFSGDPNYDEDARPFTFAKGDEMELSDKSPFGSQFTTETGYDGPWLAGTVGNQFQYIREDASFARQAAVKAAADVAEVKETLAEVKALLAALTPGGGTNPVEGTYRISKVVE